RILKKRKLVHFALDRVRRSDFQTLAGQRCQWKGTRQRRESLPYQIRPVIYTRHGETEAENKAPVFRWLIQPPGWPLRAVALLQSALLRSARFFGSSVVDPAPRLAPSGCRFAPVCLAPLGSVLRFFGS